MCACVCRYGRWLQGRRGWGGSDSPEHSNHQGMYQVVTFLAVGVAVADGSETNRKEVTSARLGRLGLRVFPMRT